MKQLEVRDAEIAYGDEAVVQQVSFSLQAGEIGCLLGPSGCGKTTLLRAVAGFQPLREGGIHLRGQHVSGPGYMLPPEQRDVGMVFQDFALYPHLDVENNVAFGLRRLGRSARRRRVDELLRLVGLEAVRRHYPHQLSGGQQQRVALIRAIAPQPKILLLDEPFSSLDVDLREQLAREVRDILQRDGITAILVTHDQMEAFAMADRIGVLWQGRLQQWDNGYRLYHQPANRFVADFIGQGVMLPGRVMDGDQIMTPLGPVKGLYADAHAPAQEVELLLRPDDVIHDDASPLQLEVVDKAFRGAAYLYTLKLPDGGEILCMVQSHHDHPIGSRIGIRLDVDHLIVFAPRMACGSGGGCPRMIMESHLP